MVSLRLFCSKVHLYVGLALGLVLVVISLTGSALVFRKEIDQWLNPELLRVAPAGERASVGEVVGRIQERFPEHSPRFLRLPQAPDRPYQIWLTEGRQAYVNPYGGAVLGARGDEEGAMNTLFALHAELLAGKTGAQIVGGIGLLTLLLAVTGLVLWWPAAALRWRRLRVGLVVAWRRGPWRLNYDVHRAGGFYTAAFLVLVALTGSGLVFYQSAGQLLNWAAQSEAPSPPPTVAPAAGPTPSLPAASLDAALQAARRALPDAQVTFVYLPAAPDAPLRIRLRAAGEWHPNGRSFVYVHPRNGAVLRVDDARRAGLGTWILHALYPLHIGSLGGWPLRVLYVVLGLAPAMLSVTGTLIWYRRWRKQRRQIGDAASRDTPGARSIPARPVAADLPKGTAGATKKSSKARTSSGTP